MTKILEKLPKVRGIYRQNAALKSWFDVGGNAEILFKPADINDLAHFLKNCPKDIAVTILGAASNVIIRDGGVEGVVVRLGGEFAKIEHDENVIKAGAATLCGNVALYAKNLGLSGLEFLTGIPGSVGGALAMNGGCYGSDVSQVLIKAKALDYDGNIIELPHFSSNSDFGFSYRENKIADKYIFVEACFMTIKSSIEAVSQNIDEFCKKREQTQPIRAKTGGSTFKNPFHQDQKAKKAWQFIDEAGFRGAKVGDAQISEKHCNFMINTNKASALDLIELATAAKKKVKDETGVDLQWEIKIIGKD